MTPRDYRESWAWVHYLLQRPGEGRAALLAYLGEARTGRRQAALQAAASEPGRVGRRPAEARRGDGLRPAAEGRRRLGRGVGPAPGPPDRARAIRPTARSAASSAASSNRARIRPAVRHFASAIGIWSILAARMKSLSESPPMAWVQISMATFL